MNMIVIKLEFITPIFMVQDNDEDLIVYAVQMGVLSKTTIGCLPSLLKIVLAISIVKQS